MREFFEEGYGAPAGFVPAEELRLRGPKGKDGTDGQAATVAVGTVTTGAAGSSASVVNRGTASAAVLDFTIPKGDRGSDGTDTDPAAVHYSADTGKTEAEKAQARSNIGAGTYTKPLGGIPDSDLAAAHYTESEADALLAAKADKHTTVKNTTSTSITVTAQKNTDYIYGELSDLTITWGTGEDNAEINLTFKSGSTATTLSVSTTGATFASYTPSANCIVHIHAQWYIDKWVVSFHEEEKETLLWELPSGATEVPAQTLLTSAQIAGYKKFRFFVGGNSALNPCVTTMENKVGNNVIAMAAGIANSTYPGYRMFMVTESGLYISNGIGIRDNPGGLTYSYLPKYIYGIS